MSTRWSESTIKVDVNQMSGFNQPPRGWKPTSQREGSPTSQRKPVDDATKNFPENLLAQKKQLWQANHHRKKPAEGAQGEGRPVEYEFGFTQSLEGSQTLGRCLEGRKTRRVKLGEKVVVLLRFVGVFCLTSKPKPWYINHYFSASILGDFFVELLQKPPSTVANLN